MRKFSQIIESVDHPSPYTWDELLYRIETGECKLVPSKYSSMDIIKEETIESIKGFLNRNLKRFPDVNTEPIEDPKRIRDGISEVGYNHVVVFDEKLAPVALITEYEMMNPFVFGDVVIVPGRDSITCYDKSTGEFKREHIR
jgi:hypothetical protein